MSDPYEAARRQRQAELNSKEGERAQLEEKYGEVWSTAEMTKEFTVQGFAAPYVVVRTNLDGVTGSLEFQHDPRFYFNFVPDK